jgi:hypothetical protein
MDMNMKDIHLISRGLSEEIQATRLHVDAASFAEEAHRDQFRKSTKPYTTHAYGVANLLRNSGKGDVHMLIAALLHDVCQEAGKSPANVECYFGEDIANLVYDVGLLSAPGPQSVYDLLSISRNTRALSIKLFDRLHNLRDLYFLPDEKINRIAKESRQIYIPLAKMLGFPFEASKISELSKLYEIGGDGLDKYKEYYNKNLEILDRPFFLSSQQINESLFLVPDRALINSRDLARDFPSLIDPTSRFYSCFISYSSEDLEFVRRLYSNLRHNNVRCWFATEDLKVGDRIRIRIDETIAEFDKVLIVLSSNSVMSQWVEQEVETALEKQRGLNTSVLIPISLDKEVWRCKSGWPKLIRNTTLIGDFSGWTDKKQYEESFSKLLKSLSKE